MKFNFVMLHRMCLSGEKNVPLEIRNKVYSCSKETHEEVHMTLKNTIQFCKTKSYCKKHELGKFKGDFYSKIFVQLNVNLDLQHCEKKCAMKFQKLGKISLIIQALSRSSLKQAAYCVFSSLTH